VSCGALARISRDIDMSREYFKARNPWEKTGQQGCFSGSIRSTDAALHWFT
jgi:hypothetical protein